MQASSGLATPSAPTTPQSLRRVHYRHPVQTLVYATLDNGNGGILRNLSESGAALQAVAPLRAGQILRVRFDLFHPKTRVDVDARVSWANSTGQAGVVFTNRTQQLCRQINGWIFQNLLRRFESAAPILSSSAADDLVLSGNARPAIRVSSTVSAPASPFVRAAASVQLPVAEPQLALSWWPQPVSFRSLARMMDVLILLSAVLLFFCVFLAIAETIPPWPATVALIAGIAGFFTALYWWICGWLGCETVGVQLARIALPDSAKASLPREPQARFR
jgi:hypothetical protein